MFLILRTLCANLDYFQTFMSCTSQTCSISEQPGGLAALMSIVHSVWNLQIYNSRKCM